MAIKDWVSLFAAGTGLDHSSAGSMESVVNGQDPTRAAQWHALRDAVIELEKQVFGGAPWFEWNGTDLTQFDTKIDGDRVSASTIAVEEFGGMNWVTMQVTATGTASPNGHAAGTILPITETPPSADYVVTADFLILTYTTTTVAAVVGRYDTALFQGYGQRFSGASSQQIVTLASVGSTRSAPGALGYTQNDPEMDTNRGSRLHLEMRGTGSDVLLRMRAAGGEYQWVRATSGLYTAVGQAGLWTAAGAASTTVKVAYRNIRCFTPVDG